MLTFCLIALAASPAAPPPWQVGTPGDGVAGWPYVSKIPLRGKSYATIQEAIDAAPDKSTIELPQGVYGLPIKIEKRHGHKLVGRDGAAYLLSQSAEPCVSCRPGPVVVISNSSEITLENLFIARDVRGDESDLFSDQTVWVDASPNTVFRHVSISSSEGTALFFTASPSAVVEDCVIENDKGGGVSVAVKKDGSGGVTIRSSFLHGQVSPVAVSSGDPCDWIGKDTQFPGIRVTDSLLWGGGWPSICPQMAAGFRHDLIIREADNQSSYKLHLEEQNTVVATREAAPPLATAPTWRPPEELAGLHLEAFGVLPPPDADAPQPGTDWPFCIKEINWPLFPEGPPTLDSYAYPASFRGCDAADVPSSRVVDHRKGYIRIATRGGGPSRQGIIEVWQREDRLFTPCMLESGGARLWTHSRTAVPVEAVDDSRVAIIGTSDVCGQEKLTEMVVVPKALRPATRRKWKLVCIEPADRGDCAPRQQELQPQAPPLDLVAPPTLRGTPTTPGQGAPKTRN